MSASLSEAERRARLRLARTETIGPAGFAELIRRHGSAAAALAVLTRRPDGPRPPSESDVDAELARGKSAGAGLMILGDTDYPLALAAIPSAPPVLWVLGDPSLLSRSLVAVVGARVASAAGQRFARGLAAELGCAGHGVVSGLARGVDAAAHEGALEAGTVAVLAGGVDDIYPPDHRDLHALIARQGAVVSEQPPGYGAQARDFPRRNRIISGLARAVVVVEAELRSGSLITARLAAEQGREVLAVPGSPLDPRARGCNDLIRQGAGLCEGVEDVLRVLDSFGGVRAPDASFETAPPEPPYDLSDLVAALLSPTPVSCDELIRAARAPAGPVLAALAELQLAGRAEFVPGGGVAAV